MPPLPQYCKKLNIPGQCCPSVQCDVPGHGAYNPVPELTAGSMPTPGPTQNPHGHNQHTTPITQLIVPVQGPITGGNQLPGGGAPVPVGTNIGSLSGKEPLLRGFLFIIIVWGCVCVCVCFVVVVVVVVVFLGGALSCLMIMNIVGT